MSYATEKTLARLSIALRERDVDADMAAQIAALMDGGISQTQASTFIGLLEGLGKKPGVADRVKVTVPGYYENDEGLVIKIVRSKKGHLYGMRQTPGGGWRYESGLMRGLDANAAVEAPEPLPVNTSDIAAAIAAAQSA